MFEYLDDKVGPVKLVNVTEARANFARLLSDDSYYVITKNNKPQRVVISYDEFRKLKGALSIENQNESTTQTSHKDKTTKPQTKSHSRVKGLLTQHFSEQGLVAEPLEEPQDDYFHTSDERNTPFAPVSTALSEQDLPQPEEIAEEHISTTTDSFEKQQHDQHILQEISESLSISDGEPFLDVKPLTKSPVVKTNDETPRKTNTESDTLTPEEREYYNKYRKLYERIDAEPAEEDQQAVFAEPKNHEVKNIVDSLPDLQGDTDDAATSFTAPSATNFSVEEQLAPNLNEDLGLSSSLIAEKSDLPSLQELLRGLNSDDDLVQADLDENEISDIIRQIRHEE